MGVQLPLKLVIVLTTVVSTGVSFLGGILLYETSIDALYATVDEVSGATTKSAIFRFSKSYTDVEREVHATMEFLRTTVELDTLGLEGTVKLAHRYLFTTIRNRPDSYALGVRLIRRYDPSQPTNATHYPPWTRPEGVAGCHVGHTTLWEMLMYYPGLEGSVFNYNATHPTTSEHGFQWYTLEPQYGMPEESGLAPVRFSSHTVTELYDRARGGYWAEPLVSVGDYIKEPFVQARYARLMELPAGLQDTSLRDYEVYAQGELNFAHWISSMHELATDGSTLLLLDPVFGVVYATTFSGRAPITLNCTVSCETCHTHNATGCLLNISTFGKTVTSAVSEAESRTRGAFFEEDLPGDDVKVHFQWGATGVEGEFDVDTEYPVNLDGGRYFLRMSAIYEGFAPHDVNLLWMRHTSSVRGKVFDALVQLIVFCVVIFVFDAVIAVMEVMLIALPMGSLAEAVGLVEVLDLTGAREVLDGVETALIVTEVNRLRGGLQFAVSSLEHYKAYMPPSLFAHDEGPAFSEVDANSGCGTNSVDNTCGVELVRVQLTKGPKLTKCLKSALLLVRVSVFSKDGEEMHDFGEVVSRVEAAAQAVRGVLHGFMLTEPGVFAVSWNMAARCDGALLRACRTGRRLCSESEYGLEKSGAPRVSCGVGSEETHAGNVGSVTHRGFAVVGRGAELAWAALDVAGALGEQVEGSYVVGSGPSFREVDSGFETLPVGVLRVGGERVLFFRVGEEHEAAQGEWMYDEEAQVEKTPLWSLMLRMQVGDCTAEEVKEFLEGHAAHSVLEEVVCSNMKSAVLEGREVVGRYKERRAELCS